MRSIRPGCALLLALILILSVGCQNTTAQLPVDPTKPPKLLLNGKALTLSPEPILVQGKLQLPFKSLMESLKIDYTQHGGTFTVIHENRYVRIETHKPAIFCNGKQMPTPTPPAIYGGALYVPADVVLGCLNIPMQYPDSETVSLEHRDAAQETTLIGGEYFVPVDVPEDRIQFLIPKSWPRLPGAPHQFGQNNHFEDFSFRYEQAEGPEQTVEEVLRAMVLQEQQAVHSNLSKERQGVLSTNGMTGISAAFVSDEKDPPTHYLFYVLKDERTIYTFVGQYTAAFNTDRIEEMMSESARSIHSGTLEVDAQKEHYWETPRFFEEGFQFSSPFYSNMEVSNRFPLQGTVQSKGIRNLFVVVSRGDDSLTFQIPVKDQKFDDLIDTPFGLGKHNIAIYAANGEFKAKDQILQASVINTNRQITRWLVPTDLISVRDKGIVGQSSQLTYQSYGDTQKAQNIFAWVVQNIHLNGGKTETPQSARQIYLNRAGTEEEIGFLYVALLRASDLPARVVAGPQDSGRFWVEVQLNGRWISSDPTLAIQKTQTGVGTKEALTTCFNMPKAYYDEKYNGSEVLPN